MDAQAQQSTEPQIAGMLPASGPLPADPEQAFMHALSRALARNVVEIESYGNPPRVLPGTRRYRANVLGEELLDPTAVDRWVAEQQRKEGKPSWWLAGLPIHPEQIEAETGEDGTLTGRIIISDLRIAPAWLQQVGPDDPDERPTLSHRMLSYSTPEHPRLTQPVRAGGALDTLRRLSLAIVGTSFWTPEQATTFVLTGLVPYAAAAEASLGQMQVRGRRARDMSAKHLTLAEFTEHRKGETLAARMAEWNDRYPTWAYQQVTNFGRDSQQAVRRLWERAEFFAHAE